MPVATYLKDKQKIIQSKYHHVTKHFESRYELIHETVVSRFHKETNKTERDRSNINDLIKNTREINKLQSKRKNLLFSKTSTNKENNFFEENIDWTRGRFSGQTIQIIVRKGKIIEKIFLTPKGNKISVKRSELGLKFWNITFPNV